MQNSLNELTVVKQKKVFFIIHLLSYSFGIHTFMHSRSSLENHDVRPKWAKSIPKFRSKRCKNHTLWGRTYLYGLYKGLSPLPPPPNPRSLQHHSRGLIVIVCLKISVSMFVRGNALLFMLILWNDKHKDFNLLFVICRATY